MRSRPDLTVYLTPPEVTPGDRLHVRVRLDSRSTTPYDSILVTLTGRENRYERTTSTGKTTHVRYHKRSIISLGARFEGGVLSPGVWERNVQIDLPPDLPPSYKSSLSSIEYELSVRVYIPWWPDRTGVYTVKVNPRKNAGRAPKACIYTTQSGELRGSDPVIELSLEDDQLFLNGTLEGAIAVAGLGKRRLRRVELSLSSIETALVRSTAGPTEIDKRTWTLCEGTPEDAKSIPFRLSVPPNVPTTFQSVFLRVDHALEARCVVAFGRDIQLRVPAVVLRGDKKRGKRGEKTATPLVGHERHRAVWEAVVGQIRLPPGADIRFDPESQMATLHVRDISIQVREELRSDAGPCLVGTLEYPNMALGLRVAERSWTDFGDKLPTLEKRFRRRFTVKARENAQAVQLFGVPMQEACLAFDEVGLDDNGAVLVHKGGVHQLAGLQRFLQHLYHFAQTLWQAGQNIPPPKALEGALAAYERFAQQTGGRLRRADCSLSQWSIRGVPLGLEHRWAGDMPVESVLWTSAPKEEEIDRWRQGLETLEQGTILLDEDRMGLILPTVSDPENIHELSDQFVNMVSRLAGGNVGPYR